MNSSVFHLESTVHGEESSRNEGSYLLRDKLSPIDVTKYVLLIAILVFSVLINFIVLYYVMSMTKRKLKRPATILVAHLSCIAILFAAFGIAFLTERIFLWQYRGQLMCEVVTFFKFTIIGVFSLNIIAIIYERFREFNRFNWGKLLLCRLILLIWITAIVTSIPTLFMVVYKEYPVSSSNRSDEQRNTMRKRICKSVPLLGMFGVTVGYELLRFILFHVSVVCYMAYAMYKIRLKLVHLRFLKPLPSLRTRKKVKTIRFIFIHFAVFIIVWLPIGVLAFVYRVMFRKQRKSPNILILTNILGVLLFLYLVLNPLIYLCLDVGCCFCIRNKRRFQGIQPPNDNLESETKLECRNNLQVVSAEVNVDTYNVPAVTVTEMMCTASESGRKYKVLNRVMSNGEVKNKQHLRHKCDSLAELQSFDMSRVSTYAVSPTSSI